MDQNDYILNEVGVDIARQKLAEQIAILLDKQNQEDIKEHLAQLIVDRDLIDKGDMKTIKKYVRGV